MPVGVLRIRRIYMRDASLGHHGQSTVETMIMTVFVSLLIFGFIHFGMLATTKSLVSFAAFSASRTAMIGGDQTLAAQGALQYLNWRVNGVPSYPLVSGPTTVLRSTRPGYKVGYAVPFGPGPVSSNIGTNALEIWGFAPFVAQPDVPEQGDNAT
jgi:hypothetical protein